MNLTHPLENNNVKRRFFCQYQSCISDHQYFSKPISSLSPHLVESANKSFIFSTHNHGDNFKILPLLENPCAIRFKMLSSLFKCM